MNPSKFKPRHDVGRGAFNAPLTLPVMPSRRFLVGLRVAHGLLAMATLLLLGHAAGGWLLAGTVVLHGALFERELVQGAARYALAEIDAEGHWWLRPASGGRLPAQVGSAWVITGSLVWLSLQGPGLPVPHTLCLMRDNVAPAVFRRLRVRLLWPGKAAR